MALTVKWLKKPPTSPVFYRKFGVSIAVLLTFVVYIANLGKILNVENQGLEIEGDSNVNKFRFVEQFLNVTLKARTVEYKQEFKVVGFTSGCHRLYFVFDSL